LPGDSEFRLTLGRSNYGLLDLFSETLEAALKSNSFERESGGRYCLSIRGIGKPIPAEEELENIRKLAGMMEETFPELASQISKAALLAEILRAGEKVEEIAAFMSRLQGVLSHIERRLRVYGLLRPVYAWTGRGLLSLMVLEGMLDPDSVGAALLAPLLPAFGFTRALARGASMLDTPELPDSARLLLELSSPVIVHPLHRGSGGKLYLDLNGTAVPVRMAHGSALSLASLILAAAPLLKAGGGVVLVDEVEHMLHPSSQAIAALLLLAMAGAGLTVVASTHSTAVATVIARLSQARSEEEARCLAARLYKRLGFRAPSGEALGLAARGARRGSAVYVVDGGHARLSQRPLEWIDRLSDTWAELGSWAASEC
ncbi:MAG: ATP-binding protein, partial [Desulfurococcales archaeon]|nr:ATP-binding protein [Desulfurococcales archaeon]